MNLDTLRGLLLASLLLGVCIPSAGAQTTVGTRASGMAGAFVAVADDASAVYWNPAGLATGAYVSFVADAAWETTIPSSGGSPDPAERQTARLMAFSLPPMGLAYYRLGSYGSGPAEPVVMGPAGREEVGRSVHALTTSTFGATLLQSLNDYIVVGTTLKIVRGRSVAGTAAGVGAEGAIDAAASLSGPTQTRGDLDAGVMVAVQRLRLGLVARNLTTPSFDTAPEGGAEVELARQVRVGGAWGSGWPGRSRVVVAVDADLTARASLGGDRRDVAAGVETWWRAERVGLRAGVRRSLIGEARPVVAAGVSAGITAGAFVEAHVARGSRDERSWSIGARFTY